MNPAFHLKNTVIAIVGPTCSGKTKLSIDLAEKLNGEIVSCDSRNIYKHMDIGTAKPTLKEMRGITHHLIDVCEPDTVFTVAQYKSIARKAIDKIMKDGAVPIVCGGTGFYARALLEGLSIPEVGPNQKLRDELENLALEKGNSFLYNMLKQKDPAAVEKINENDKRRIIRALEVMDALSIPFSKTLTKEEVPFKVVWFGLNFEDRTNLKERIVTRLNEQIEQGLEAEVRALYRKYGKTRSLINAVTYKQFISYFENQISYDEAVEECVKHNYQLARKQLMWFRANPEMNWLTVDSKTNLLDEILKKIA